MNKFFKYFLVFILGFIMSVMAGFFGCFLVLTSKTINLPFFNFIDIEKLLPQKNVIIEKTEEIHVDSDVRIGDAYNSVKDTMVSIALQNNKNVYLNSDVLNSGFVLTADGWIFTNNQSLFDKNKKYVVMLKDGKYYDVADIIFDKYDFVFMKINNQKMSVVPFASYNDVNVGSVVFSDDSNGGIFVDYIKNKNNGSIQLLQNYINNVCLFDSKGRVVGVYGANYSNGKKDRFGKVEIIKTKNIFSPEYLKNSIYSINLKSDIILRPSFDGFSFSGLNNVIASSEKIDKGLYIESVNNDLGYNLFVGDLITVVDGYKINNPIDFIIQNYKVGDKLNFTLIREGKEIVNSIVLR